jgi:hypothetical protein
MVETASYIIFKDGSTYYSKNGTSGAIECSDTNASYVFNVAIESLPNQGGKVFVTPAIYSITSPIYIDKNMVTIEGEVAGVDWGGDEQEFSVQLQHGSNSDMFVINGTLTTDGRVWYPTLRNLVLFDPFWTYTGYGIRCDNAAMLILDHIHFERFKSGALFIRDTWGAEVNWAIVSNSGSISPATSAIYLRGSYPTSQNTNMIFQSCLWEFNNGTALDAYGVIDQLIVDNWYAESIEGGTTASMFKIESCGGVVISNGVIWNCQGIGVEIIGMAAGRVVNNRFTDQHGTGIKSDAAYTIYIAGNYMSANAAHSSGYGIQAGGRSIIIGNHIQDFAGSGVDVTSSYCTLSNNLVKNCGSSLPSWHKNTGMLLRGMYNIVTSNTLEQGTYQTSGIWVSSLAPYCIISANDMTGVNWPVNYSCSRDLVELSNNIGFNTSRIGTATVTTSTSTTFNHNLFTTPTFVTCSFSPIGIGNWTWTATITQITITVSTSGSYTLYWKAEF